MNSIISNLNFYFYSLTIFLSGIFLYKYTISYFKNTEGQLQVEFQNVSYLNLKRGVLIFQGLLLLICVILWILFNNSLLSYNYLYVFFTFFNYNLTPLFGLDGISFYFVFLTVLIFPLCTLLSWNTTRYKPYLYFILYCLLEVGLILAFSVVNVFLFYVLFEVLLFPMFLIIGVWGSRLRKIRANYLFFYYTLIGSMFFLLSIVYIYVNVGTTDLDLLKFHNFTFTEELFLWLGFFLGFMVKVPMIPFHLWLPEAHVEAPTTGSVILAGILLKLGSYGLIRFSLTLFPTASYYFSPLVYVLCVISIIYASFSAMTQSDMKRIIAYASIAHMNLIVLGIFSFDMVGLEGAVLQSISHGVVSSGLFILIGVVYDRYHNRILNYYTGLVNIMPIYSILFLIYILANIGVPGTSNFVGELMLLLGIVQENLIVTFLGGLGLILGAIYSLFLYNRVTFGNINSHLIKTYQDVVSREFFVLAFLGVFIFVLGLYPNIFINLLHMDFLGF